MKQLKVISIAIIVIALILSNGYIALAYITRHNSRDIAPTLAEPSVSPAQPGDHADFLALKSVQKPTPTEKPVDAPIPTGYVYLTIDDGPDSVTTPLILDILDHYNIKATFFVIGTHIEKNPELVVEIDQRGHYVGNHTYNHRYKEIYASRQAFVTSLRINETLIYDLIGKRPQIVRDPGGLLKKRPEIRAYTERHGYTVMDWNVDSFDSRTPVPSSATIAENIQRQSLQTLLWPEMVILIHETKAHMSTVQALPEIIESLLTRGFEFVIPTYENI